jgi:hypothetical protein
LGEENTKTRASGEITGICRFFQEKEFGGDVCGTVGRSDSRTDFVERWWRAKSGDTEFKKFGLYVPSGLIGEGWTTVGDGDGDGWGGVTAICLS